MRDLSRQAAAGHRYLALVGKADEPSERVHALSGRQGCGSGNLTMNAHISEFASKPASDNGSSTLSET